MNRRGMLAGSLMFLILLSSVVMVTLAVVGPGVLADVNYCGGGSVPKDAQGKFVVVPGGSYRVIITNVEYSGAVSVWIKGKYKNGTPWIIELENQDIIGGTITSTCFTIPENAGCTIVVAYYHQGHLAAESPGSNNPGHMKTFGDDEPPFDNPVPCEGEIVPEFPFAPEAIAALCLVAWTAVRRRRKL